MTTRDEQTVASVMVRRPVTHPPDLTVRSAREALLDPHRHLLLLVRDDVLVGTVAREDLRRAETAVPALGVSRLVGRTVPPEHSVIEALAAMRTTGVRRLAVVDRSGVLLGLLCLKSSGLGFCSDEGIAARARAVLVTAP